MTDTMKLDRAGALVLADARQNSTYLGVCDADVLEDVRGRITIDEVLDYEEGDELTEAYRVYLAHHQNPTRAQLCALIIAISGAEPELMPAHYRVWHQRCLRGDLY